jgi:hypothetical protein
MPRPCAPRLVRTLALGCVCAGFPAGCSRASSQATGVAGGAQATSTRVVASPRRARLAIWDSDKGEAGKGWTDCDQKPSCRSVVSRASGMGAGSDVIAGIRWHVVGSGWAGMGWCRPFLPRARGMGAGTD